VSLTQLTQKTYPSVATTEECCCVKRVLLLFFVRNLSCVNATKIVARKYVRTELRQDGRVKIVLIAATYEGLADEGWEGCDVAYGATQVFSKTYVKDWTKYK